MPRTSSATFILMAVAGTAGIIAAAARKGRLDRSMQQTQIEHSPESAHAPIEKDVDRTSGRFVQIASSVMIVICVLAIAIATFLPMVVRAMPAPNEDIRDHYGINVVDNPEFAGSTFLRGGDDGLAYVCDRPNRGDVLESMELTCYLP